MFRLFLDSSRRFLGLVWQTFTFGQDDFNSRSLKRIVVMLVFLPLFAIVQLVHWIGFFLDELFFPSYRKVEIKQPVFVVGVPRSGTTLLHRVLAKDRQFTTFTTWECLFALSITQRKFWFLLINLDQCLGRPLAHLLSWLEKSLTRQFNDIHASGLTESEEDYFVFTPILACFLLILPFPFAESIWRMGSFDQSVSPQEKDRIMGWYKACLQKHLYVHGRDKTFLSKNAAFASLVAGLNATFPDGRYLCCVRDPVETLPSQISSLRPGFELFCIVSLESQYRDRFIELFQQYYEHLFLALSVLPDTRHQFVPMPALQHDLLNTLTDAYERLGLRLSDEQREVLQQADENSRKYKSARVYDLTGDGLDGNTIRQQFASVYTLFDGLRFDQQSARTWRTTKNPTSLNHSRALPHAKT